MKTRRLTTLLLAIVLVLGLLPATAPAEDDIVCLPDATGTSYEIKDCAVKLFVPYAGYQGTEVIDSARKVSWTVKGNTGALLFGSNRRYGEDFYESFRIDGGDYVNDVVIEMVQTVLIKPKDTSACALRVSNANLTIRSKLRNYVSFLTESIVVDNGNLTTETMSLDLPQSTAIDPSGIYVPNGDILIDVGSSVQWVPIYTGGKLTLDGSARLTKTTASAIQIGYNRVVTDLRVKSSRQKLWKTR